MDGVWEKTIEEFKEAKSKVTEEIRKTMEKHHGEIERDLERLGQLEDSCNPEAISVAVELQHKIDRQESVSQLYLALGDQPEEAHHRVSENAHMQHEKLEAMVREFVKACSCAHNT